MEHLILSKGDRFAAKLVEALKQAGFSVIELPASRQMPVRELAANIFKRLQPDTHIVVDSLLFYPPRSTGPMLVKELLLILRCQLKLANPVTFYGIGPLTTLLQGDPDLFIMASPGTQYIALPVNPYKLRLLRALKPLPDLALMRPYLTVLMKSTLAALRHEYANYAAMTMMLDIAKRVYDVEDDRSILGEGDDLVNQVRNTLPFAIYTTLYGLNPHASISPEALDSLKLETQKRVLLIDDLAMQGWRQILGQIIYGRPDTEELASLDLSEVTNDDDWLDNAIKTIKKTVSEHKPHLILLDLRLKNETGPLSLRDLSGYQLLNRLKSSSHLQGIPVIMFTASNNVRHVRQLLRQGAVFVWTKPGIDERLNSPQILDRYQELIHTVRDVLEQFNISFYASLNTNSSEAGMLAFEKMRSRLLEHAAYIRYRCKLQKADPKPHYFSDFTDIFIDTNVLMTGVVHRAGKGSVDFAETILNVFHLAQICGTKMRQFEVDNDLVQLQTPQLVVINEVLDEIMKLSKKTGDSGMSGKNWKRALIGYDIIRSIFEDSQRIRTEFNTLDAQHCPAWELLRPKQDAYADDALIDEIGALIRQRAMPVHVDGKKYLVKPAGAPAKVLLICDENPLSKVRPETKLPNRLREELTGVTDLSDRLRTIRLAEFNEIMKNMPL